MSNKLDQNFWKKYFEVYDVLNIVIPYRELLKTISDLLNIQLNDRVLDAGCGTGNLATELNKLGADVFGIDSSEAALAIYKNKDKSAKTVLGDITHKLPFENNYFDKIACNNTFYTISIEKRMDLIKELYRVLKPGGIIVISDIVKGFSPLEIYKDHIKKSIRRYGIIYTIRMMMVMLIPTMKMFKYNSMIKKADTSKQYSFVSDSEHFDLLKEVGFRNISINYMVYSDQAIANSAVK